MLILLLSVINEISSTTSLYPIFNPNPKNIFFLIT